MKDAHENIVLIDLLSSFITLASILSEKCWESIPGCNKLFNVN